MKKLWLGLAVGSMVALCVAPTANASTATQRARIDAAIKQAIKTQGLNAVIVHVNVRGKRVIKKAYGWSEPGVPANTRMHFRNGNVAATYITTLLMRLVDQRKVKLDDKVSKWLPWLRDSNRVTLRQLAGMTAGYHDYEQDPRLAEHLYGNPFGVVSTNLRLNFALSRPLQFEPGSNWSYAHSDYVILGLALEKITRGSLASAIRRYVLKPLGLKNTRSSTTSYIQPPVLHTYSSERKSYLQIPPSERFLEETTYWNPAWSFPRGGVMTQDITDMTRGSIAIGGGKLLSRKSYRTQVDPRIGFGRAVTDGSCEDCRQLTYDLGYGLGVFRYRNWIAAQPLFAGLGSVAAYLPSKRIAISIVAALGERNFSPEGQGNNYSRQLYTQIAAIVAPNDAPPPPK